jgi:hypothetical protein
MVSIQAHPPPFFSESCHCHSAHQGFWGIGRMDRAGLNLRKWRVQVGDTTACLEGCAPLFAWLHVFLGVVKHNATIHGVQCASQVTSRGEGMLLGTLMLLQRQVSFIAPSPLAY